MGYHPNSLAALERYRPKLPNALRCTRIAKRTGKRCQALAIKGKLVCYRHGGAHGRVPRTPYQIAVRARGRAVRMGLVSPDLARDASWIRANARCSANAGVLVAMLAAWGARDVEMWARAVAAIV